MTDPICTMQAHEVFAQLAEGIGGDSDVRVTLRALLEPIVRQCGALAGAIHLHPEHGGAAELVAQWPLADSAHKRGPLVTVTLAHANHVYGCLTLRLSDEQASEPKASAFRAAVGALMGLALDHARQGRELQRLAPAAQCQALTADLHDGIAPALMFAKMRLPLLQDAIQLAEVPRALAICAEIGDVIGNAHTNLRTLLSQYRMPMEPLGLRVALRRSAESFQALTQIDLTMRDGTPEVSFSAEQELQVFLFVQEALSNIAKHAHAQHAWIEIAQQGGQASVQVQDDGAGLAQASESPSPSHFGLDIMRQRAQRLRGSFSISARLGGGTQVRMSFPLSASLESA